MTGRTASRVLEMAAEKVVVGGAVKGGGGVPDRELLLPEGAYVEIVFPFAHISAELQSEFEAWDRAGAIAWAMIDRQEKLEVLLLAGLDRGPSAPTMPQDWQDIRQEVRKRVAQNGEAGAKKMVAYIDPNNVTEPVSE
jgi:hypothetical protein